MNEEPTFSDIHCVDNVNSPLQRSVSTIDDVSIRFEEGLAFESRLPSTRLNLHRAASTLGAVGVPASSR